MFDQLIWYFCLAFTSACAGKPLPGTGCPAGPLLPPASPSWGPGRTLLQPLAQHQRKPFPPVLGGEESECAARCRSTPRSPRPQPPLLWGCEPLPASGPCAAGPGTPRLASALPAPRPPSQATGDPQPCPRLRALPAHRRVVLVGDAAAALSGLAPGPTPPAALSPGRPPGAGG